ncbi:MAG TPA: FAD-dependent oxidoreductase [Kofleriaceae bacterium]|nr:FAD-dependent oxidoreductase [Kofleriaceae bacterium]
MIRVVVIGAGPIGLAAAHGALARGFDVTVLEAGDVGDALRRWGTTRLFTPLAMNLPPALVARLPAPPPGDALLTGPELAERVLAPLAGLLGTRLRTHHRVVQVTRARLARTDFAGHPLRAERPFRLFVDTPAGEIMLEADRVLDASGVYGLPLLLGARGERAVADRLIRDLGALARSTVRLVGRRVLLVGHGHSAANALAVLDALARTDPGTRLTWAVRSPNARPCVEVADDPLPERRAVVARANEIAQHPPAYLTVERRATVEAIDLAGDRSGDALSVTLSGDRRVEVDELVALTGYRPDLSFLSELAIETSPVTEGAARLARAISRVTDCLSVPCVSPADLDSGEPGFHFIGAKSYGRSRTFLLQNGLAQLEKVLERL